ncbi:MauE/DoxX family redox-associated membrane protein [Rossellomorea vietnamensis]|uniref:MauE/DoxX family redox-associated membrane protein n=1 Tax=Rossellomorea vietnamensis TaxID=218284 RepID=UPI003D2B44FD
MLNISLMIIGYILSIMFVMSVIDKVSNWGVSVAKLEEYKLIPKKLSKFMNLLFILIETYLSVVFFIHWIPFYNVALYLFLMMVYTVAVLINIYRGNIFISCGCGGVLEKDRLSKSMVIRNISLMIIGTLLLAPGLNFVLLSFESIVSLLTAICIVLLYGSALKLKANMDLIIKLRKKIAIFED